MTKEELAKLLQENPDLGIENLNGIEEPHRNALPAKSDRVKAKSSPMTGGGYCKTVQGDKRHVSIKMLYPGCVITEDNCYGRNGKHTFMKPEAREWQNDLIMLVKNCGVKDWRLPLKVTMTGTFKSQRESCDIQNLKIVYDGIEQATGLNDRQYNTETIPGVIDKTVQPFILITISEI